VRDDYPDRYVVVGVTPQQPAVVVQQAARFARHFEAALVCANVDPGSYVVAEHPDGSVESRPIDPDLPEWTSSPFDGELADRIRTLAREEQVQVSFRELAGDIGHALARLAAVLHAEMIIVGSRRGGLKTSMHDFFGGSVAVHLAHRQPRPVVVIPLSPVPTGAKLPWEEHHQ
jgi:nucleotide-binding universal stress UspA family protein